jgi:hypothetical protein
VHISRILTKRLLAEKRGLLRDNPIMTDAPLLDAIVNPFIESAKRDGFNGVEASALLGLQSNPEKLRASLSAFIRDGQITAVFSRLSVNMHIKRFPDPPVEEQLKLLIDEPLEAFGLYPTASVVSPRVDLSAWQDRPFSKALLLAEGQLSFRAFDMGALERHVADPRYDVRFDPIRALSQSRFVLIDAPQSRAISTTLSNTSAGDGSTKPFPIRRTSSIFRRDRAYVLCATEAISKSARQVDTRIDQFNK